MNLGRKFDELYPDGRWEARYKESPDLLGWVYSMSWEDSPRNKGACTSVVGSNNGAYFVSNNKPTWGKKKYFSNRQKFLEYCKKNNFPEELIFQFFVVGGLSGAKQDQPEPKKVMNDNYYRVERKDRKGTSKTLAGV